MKAGWRFEIIVLQALQHDRFKTIKSCSRHRLRHQPTWTSSYMNINLHEHQLKASVPTYKKIFHDWSIKTIKHNTTNKRITSIIYILKNESQTLITFALASQSQNMLIKQIIMHTEQEETSLAMMRGCNFNAYVIRSTIARNTTFCLFKYRFKGRLRYLLRIRWLCLRFLFWSTLII